MQHPDEGTIHAWLDGQLRSEERAQLEQHLNSCEQCSALVVEARGLVAGATRIVGALDGVRGGVIPPNKSAAVISKKSLWRTLRFTPVRAAVAATLLLAAGTIFTIQEGTPQMHDVARPTMAAPASDAAPMSASAPVAVTAAPPAAAPRPAAQMSKELWRNRVVAVDSTSVAPEKPRVAALADSAAADTRREIVADAREPRHADSLAMRAESKVALPATSSPRRKFAGAIQPSEAITTGMAQTTDPRAVGCYRLDVDSSRARFTNLLQFGLSAPNGVNVVRALGTLGRPDSVIAGAAWRPVDRDSIAVSAPNGAQRATLVFALAEEGSSSQGRLTTADQTMPVKVLRTRCR